MPVVTSNSRVSTGSGDGSLCCCYSGSGGLTCCTGPFPSQVTVTFSTGCTCLGPQVLPFDPVRQFWVKQGIVVCTGTIELFFFCTVTDDGKYAWTLILGCVETFGGVVFQTAPTDTPPPCCPISLDMERLGYVGPVLFCCQGVGVTDFHVHVAGDCP